MRKVLLGVLVALCAAPPAAFLFAWSGLYNVAASSGHLAPISWFLAFGMKNSIETYAIGVEAPPLDDPALAERGMLYFQSGCAPCHGAPGQPRSPVAKQMLPPPPDLTHVSQDWPASHLFRMVKHGIKYTGMPAWAAPSRDDEVWALVAFLKRMARVTPEAYRAATIPAGQGNDAAQAIANEGLIVGPFACAGCHGLRGEGSSLGGVPRLAGQKASYLEMALQDFRLGTRPSGMMQPPAVFLDQEQRSDLSRYYAEIDLDSSERDPLTEAESKLFRRGAEIAEEGVPSRGIPGCAACHGKDGRARDNVEQYPVLAGQHADYLANQLRLFRAGNRGGRLAEIMSSAARNLTDEDIGALALHYSALR